MTTQTTTPAQTSDPARDIPTRRISFTAFEDLPQHFAGGDDLVMSHILAGLSALFPDGEDFFVRSVRHFRDQITDPVLKKQVSGFIGQEALHGREHRAFNDRLAEMGYPTKRIERFTRWGLAQRERIMSPASNLAATAALEHFTAILAEALLEDADRREAVGHPEVLNLLLWHALEESEHKAVAFDVFRAVGGSERTRVLTMKFVRVAFIIGNTVQVATSLAGDRRSYRRGELRASLRRLRTNPFLQREIWQRLKDYDRADFHPDDRDTEELVTRWREQLFGQQGELVGKLASNAA